MNIIDWIKGKGGEKVEVKDEPEPEKPEKPEKPANTAPVSQTWDQVEFMAHSLKHQLSAHRGKDLLQWSVFIDQGGFYRYEAWKTVWFEREQLRSLIPVLQAWADGKNLSDIELPPTQ